MSHPWFSWFPAYYKSVIAQRLLWKPLDHFSYYKMQQQLPCLRVSARWIALTSVHYGLHWLPGCFWMQFKRVAFDLWSCIHFKPETIYPTITHSGQDETGNHCWNCIIIQSQYLSQSSLPSCHYLGNSAELLVCSWLDGWPNIEDKV